MKEASTEVIAKVCSHHIPMRIQERGKEEEGVRSRKGSCLER